jgi:hypothetical protein
MESTKSGAAMKNILLITLLSIVLAAPDCQAQNWNEWFKQKKTQRRYHARQLILLKVYLEYVKKGVTIVRRGLNTIENVKNGNFNLHRDFFSYLDNVNPHIANSAKVADIIAYQVFIVQEMRAVNNYCRRNSSFTPEEVAYVADVYANLLVLCDANLSELLMIIKPNKTKMSDDERLQRIDKVHTDMKDQDAFVRAFDQDVKFIAHERKREQLQLDHLRTQYDLR